MKKKKITLAYLQLNTHGFQQTSQSWCTLRLRHIVTLTTSKFPHQSMSFLFLLFFGWYDEATVERVANENKMYTEDIE